MKKLLALSLLALSSSVFNLSNAQTITNEAGNNTLGYGYSGNGGLATNAQLYYPIGVGVDTSGNLYITDSYNNVIRKVNAITGIISTFAGNGIAGFSGDGGQATAAELNIPSGTAFDTLGNLYIADRSNNRIREVNISTGIITTVAGNGAGHFSGDGGLATAAELYGPSNLAFDRHSNMYIADCSNNVIRKVTYSSGIISTVAGMNGYVGFSGDGGPATSAEFYDPSGITLDTNGNMFIVDASNYRIREVIASTGIISTFAGNGNSGYTGDGGQATSAELSRAWEVWIRKTGILYIADEGANAMRDVIISTGIINTVAGGNGSGYTGDGGSATAAEINYPACAAFNKAGDMFIADDMNQVIREVNTSGIITTFAGNNTLGWGYSGDGGIATSAQLHAPSSVVLDAAGNRYIADFENQVIRKISHDTISTIAGNYLDGAGYSGDGGQATAAELNNPSDVAVDASNNIYIADYSNNVIRKVSGGIISTVAGKNSLGPGYGGDGGPATAAQLNNPSGVAVDSVGNIYIADFGNNLIREVTVSNGTINTYAGNFGLGGGFSGDGGPATAAQLDNPLRVRVGNGLVIVSEVGIAFVPGAKKRDGGKITGVGDGNQDIRGITNTNISTVAGNHSLGSGFSGDGGPATAAQLYNPAGIAIDAQNNIYVADYNNNVIREVSAGNINTIAGNYAFGGGFSGNGGPATAAELKNPSGVAITDTGLYIADNSNQVVRKVKLIPTGINTIKSPDGSMLLYPNPATDKLYIDITEQGYIPKYIAVFDITGRLLLSFTIQNATSTIPVDVSSLEPGMYFLKVLDSNFKQNVGRFVIVN